MTSLWPLSEALKRNEDGLIVEEGICGWTPEGVHEVHIHQDLDASDFNRVVLRV